MNNKLSIRAKLRLISLSVFCVAILIVMLADYSVTSISMLRAYVGGESSWSKGLNEAIFSANKYGHSLSESDFIEFKSAIQIPMSANLALHELETHKPDLNKTAELLI